MCQRLDLRGAMSLMDGFLRFAVRSGPITSIGSAVNYKLQRDEEHSSPLWGEGPAGDEGNAVGDLSF
ncbi:hypothetical protein Sa4125_37260 [Aureimonas sp. SA4125]|nr:hypothetical protein Sa4125_37260 [Aureimonas sp. SA4125]